MIEMKRILVPTDFSDHARVALRYAKALGEAFGAEIIVCHVSETSHWLSQVPPTGEAYFPANFSEIQAEQSAKACESLLNEEGVSNGRVVVRQGSAFAEVLTLAKEENVDLIVVGTHGRGAVAHMLLGSVAEKVVRKAPCPVLTVRQGEHDFVMP